MAMDDGSDGNLEDDLQDQDEETLDRDEYEEIADIEQDEGFEQGDGKLNEE